MLTIMKYEIIRQKFSKWIMFGLLAVLEAVFLITLALEKSDAMGYAILGLATLAMFSFLYVSLESIINYNQDLSRKSGYMVFMTPYSVFEILGAKILNSIVMIVMTAVVFGVTAFLDITLLLIKNHSLESLMIYINDIIKQFTDLDVTPASIISVLVLAVIFWISTVAIAFLALTLTYTFLQTAPAKVFISFLIFIGLNVLHSMANNEIMKVLPKDYFSRAIGTGIFTAAIAALCVWLNGWMLTRKMAL